MTFDKILAKQIGLSDEGILIYQALIKYGPLGATKLSQQTNLGRTNLYNTLQSLEQNSLIKKHQTTAKVIFSPAHPSILSSKLLEREATLSQARRAMESLLPDLLSDYNLSVGNPGVEFFEGTDGLKKIYEDILANCQGEYIVVLSTYGHTYSSKMMPYLKKYLKRRIEKNIKVTAFTPPRKPEPPAKVVQYHRQVKLGKNDYTAPVEIDVYANKVAILSFDKELIGLTIESKQIAQSTREFLELVAKGCK